MGITTKIWPASQIEIEKCLAEPAHVDHLFWRCEDYAQIHDAPALPALLGELARHGALVREVAKAKETSFVVGHRSVGALHDAHRELFAFPSICVNKVQIADIVERARLADRGLVFCSYEDW